MKKTNCFYILTYSDGEKLIEGKNNQNHIKLKDGHTGGREIKYNV